jgi:hypothetical protein
MSDQSGIAVTTDPHKDLQNYGEGWLAVEASILDDTRDSMSFSAWLTGMATGGIGLVAVRVALPIEQTSNLSLSIHAARPNRGANPFSAEFDIPSG